MEFQPDLPLERASTLPSRYYTDPAIAEREREAIFARTWQCVGRAEQVANPGQFLTVELAGEPLLIVRGSDGILRGFFNVCRHRAAPLLSEPAGSCPGKIRCRYHGWTYDLEGRLRGTPEFDGVCDFAKETSGLKPITVEIHGDFVWVHILQPEQSLANFMHQMSDWIQRFQPLQNLRWYARKTYDLNCNWKVYVDNYLDGGYHVNTVHPALADAIDYREYRTEIFGNASLQSSPLIAAEGAVGATRTGTAFYWYLFPNFMLNHYAGVMDTNWVLPLDPDHCRVVFDFYFSPEADEQFRRESLAVAEQVQQEDILICEQVQLGLHSRSYDTGRFSVKRELAGHQFHKLCYNYIRLVN